METCERCLIDEDKEEKGEQAFELEGIQGTSMMSKTFG